jgi:hypothetical protein
MKHKKIGGSAYNLNQQTICLKKPRPFSLLNIIKVRQKTKLFLWMTANKVNMIKFSEQG